MRLIILLFSVILIAVVESRHYRRVPSELRRWHGSSVPRSSVLSRGRRSRDPVRERSQANYQKSGVQVIQELNDKFRNLIEGCFPRPKGCLCVVTDANGREVRERRKNQSDCETTDPSRLEAGRAVHDDRDRGGKKAPDYGQRGRDSHRRLRRH